MGLPLGLSWHYTPGPCSCHPERSEWSWQGVGTGRIGRTSV